MDPKGNVKEKYGAQYKEFGTKVELVVLLYGKQQRIYFENHTLKQKHYRHLQQFETMYLDYYYFIFSRDECLVVKLT